MSFADLLATKMSNKKKIRRIFFAGQPERTRLGWLLRLISYFLFFFFQSNTVAVIKLIEFALMDDINTEPLKRHQDNDNRPVHTKKKPGKNPVKPDGGGEVGAPANSAGVAIFIIFYNRFFLSTCCFSPTLPSSNSSNLLIPPLFRPKYESSGSLKWDGLDFSGFYWVWLCCIGFSWALLGFTGFYWVLLYFTVFYWVLLGITGF